MLRAALCNYLTRIICKQLFDAIQVIDYICCFCDMSHKEERDNTWLDSSQILWVTQTFMKEKVYKYCTEVGEVATK